MRYTILVFLLAGPAFATSCPQAPDHSVALSKLITEAREATDSRAGLAVSDKMWELWAEAPDA
ncbi:MAG: hypothetical protein AAFO72_05295, partial [Pseudomonadota bacterium]